jgi:acetyl-CoA acetyltransferase
MNVFYLIGNASQVSDGAAAVLLTKRSTAKRLGLPILGEFVTSSVIGVPPKIMGVGPAYAIPKVLNLTGLTLEDVDFLEAFASQAVISVQHLGIGEEKVSIVSFYIIVSSLFLLFHSLHVWSCSPLGFSRLSAPSSPSSVVNPSLFHGFSVHRLSPLLVFFVLVFDDMSYSLHLSQDNINGGAITIGHPLGCTGARQVATGLSIVKQTGGRVFVTSMCIGTGMAAVFVSEH